MNTQANSSLSWYKLSFITTGIILILNSIASLIATNFKAKYLSVIFTWEYPIYNIGFEGFIILLCIVPTILFTSKLPDFSFKTVIIRLSVMSVLYLLFSLVFQLVFYFIFSLNDLDNPKSITSQFLNLKYFLTGMRYSFILMVIWMVLKYRNNSNQKDLNNPEG